VTARKGSKSRRSARPGRPAADKGVEAREALLAEASRLFALHGADGVSLRRIAKAAGVTPAMIHYYFGSKEGLYDAMLARTFARVVSRVRTAMSRGGGLADLLDVLIEAFAAEPWIPTLVVREVLTEGGRFREQFIRDYASHMAEILPGLIRREIKAGRFRRDLDPTLAFLSLIGMTVMPFVARPVIERVLDIEYDESFLSHLAEHTHAMFIQGAGS
jgi:AcrR family transcriptional regulator